MCGNYLCQDKQTKNKIYSFTRLEEMSSVCDGEQDCLNTEEDEKGCGSTTTMRSGGKVESSKICDDKCDTKNCEDEANCNNVTYGLYCSSWHKGNWTFKYIPPRRVCDTYEDCDGGEDEANCVVGDESKNKSICKHHWSKRPVPVHNFTKCGVMGYYSNYCADLKEYQTNCTDQSRVGLTCKISGYESTVSRYLICYDANVDICDDNIENQCPKISKSCTVHKHQLCNEKPDCEDYADETHPICHHQTEATCKRKVGGAGKLRLPLVWILDGIEDCVDGSDEIEIWPSCGEGQTYRYTSDNSSCERVFVCLWGEPGYVELDNFCDGIDTCGNENKICSVSRNSQTISSSVLSTKNGLVKHLSFCIKGLRSIGRLGNINCTQDYFMFPDFQNFGVETQTMLLLPNGTQNCDYLYGEQYVFTSCTNRCVNSTCPLRNLPRYDVCPDQYPDRIGTIANNEHLMFFTKSHGNIYTNRYFVCDNKMKCVEYSKVCDLVYDCGDRSDESACTNHFKCQTSSDSIIPKSKKCDGKFDCADFTDECNEQCSKQILKSYYIKILTWFLGLLAVVANLTIIIKSARTLRRSKNVVVLANKSMVVLISSGEFLIGCYLLSTAVYDSIVFKQGYCFEQLWWITSTQCSVIGVVSTIGSQVTIFSMTILSFVRLSIIWNSKKIPGQVTRANALLILIGANMLFAASAAIAIIPILNRFEQLFVNGVKFDHEQIPLFIGTPQKEEILAVIESYYGRMKKSTITWDLIIKMVINMFSYSSTSSHEHGPAIVKKVHFYGNDGVCLFKYFVDKDDPQINFVWTILVINSLCFFCISTSYLLIASISYRSSRNAPNAHSKKQSSSRTNKMNQRITGIIISNFVSWVPFIIICILHSVRVFNATRWYALFSMIILPLKSVINPLVCDDTITKRIGVPVKKLNSAVCQSVRRKSIAVQPQAMELGHVQQEPQEEMTIIAVTEPQPETGIEPNILSGTVLYNVNTEKKGLASSGITEEGMAIEKC